jgi:hypothetical protein
MHTAHIPVPHNELALGMVIGGLGLGAGIAWLVGCADVRGIMLIGEPLAIAADLAYRARLGRRHWFHPHYGGHIAFAPVWLVGILVVVLVLLLEW